eukprot:TRINITY_DN5536_c0_g1_i2.p4 TRINITY_DN5536_c0_g1~~TRINITY_DN5536_c0_g1_i2.p4  ORF type:complete len:112 (+),score=23.11 TRINITY_DN5536_c0_g1_i2:187-522(+)
MRWAETDYLVGDNDDAGDDEAADDLGAPMLPVAGQTTMAGDRARVGWAQQGARRKRRRGIARWLAASAVAATCPPRARKRTRRSTEQLGYRTQISRALDERRERWRMDGVE